MALLKSLTACSVLLGSMLSPCMAGEELPAPEKALDFWLGEWTVTDTTPDAKNPAGTNVIRKLYGGKVIHESFKMGTFEGQSWSVFNPKQKTWSQTWVDNNGAYIAMTSTEVNGNLAIQTLKRQATPLVANRMVFTDVKPNSFNWRWEATKDGGKSWTLSWRLAYKRKAQPKDLSNALSKAASMQSRFDSWR